MLEDWTEFNNTYAASRLPRSRRKKVTASTISRFFAIIYYMGVVRLSCKEDYFEASEDDEFWPKHPSIMLSYSIFRYMWRNFHMTYRSDEIKEDDDDDFEADLEEDESPAVVAPSQVYWGGLCLQQSLAAQV